jgi:hypothetical protein
MHVAWHACNHVVSRPGFAWLGRCCTSCTFYIPMHMYRYTALVKWLVPGCKLRTTCHTWQLDGPKASYMTNNHGERQWLIGVQQGDNDNIIYIWIQHCARWDRFTLFWRFAERVGMLVVLIYQSLKAWNPSWSIDATCQWNHLRNLATLWLILEWKQQCRPALLSELELLM